MLASESPEGTGVAGRLALGLTHSNSVFSVLMAEAGPQA